MASVDTARLDVTEVGELEGFAGAAARRLGEIDLVLVAAGDLGTAVWTISMPRRCRCDRTTNFAGPAAATMALAARDAGAGCGRIVVLSSVAGVRVRKANFVYGSAKAGLDGFALGLADALEGSGVEVTVVRPGFVRTKMTAGLEAAAPRRRRTGRGQAIVRGLETGAAVVWVPALLRPIFGLLRLLPRPLAAFARLSAARAQPPAGSAAPTS